MSEPVTVDQVRAGFPAEIAFPPILEKFIDWYNRDYLIADGAREPLTDYFELDIYGRDAWMHPANDYAKARLAKFGMAPDGGQYCIWAKEDGTCPVVYLGTGQGAYVSARSIDDFIVLLAVGYPALIRLGDYASKTPEETSKAWETDGPMINHSLRQWVKETMGRDVPATGKDLIETRVTDAAFYDWMKTHTADPGFY